MSLDERLWGPRAHTAWIVLAAAFLILCMLGSGALWTQEGRWALICEQMQRSGDVWHPSLLGEPYFGKPLLSYWAMLVVASVTGTLDEIADVVCYLVSDRSSYITGTTVTATGGKSRG